MNVGDEPASLNDSFNSENPIIMRIPAIVFRPGRNSSAEVSPGVLRAAQM
jgi:hypothetical protein